MIKIQRISRPLRDEKEFKKYKNYKPFEDIRQVAKSANFSLLFGASANTFMSNTIEPMWALQQAEDFIRTKDLYSLQDTLIQYYVDKNRPIPYSIIPYLTCATFIRNTFFQKYKGLMERIERNKELVEQQGYTRTYHGVIRRLPLLMIKGKDDEYKEISNWNNISSNSEIQSLEVATILPSLTKISRWFRRMGLKSRVWGTVHDSVDFYLHKAELDIVIPKIYEIFEIHEVWQKGIPLTIDLKIADYKKGMVYHSGVTANKYLAMEKK